MPCAHCGALLRTRTPSDESTLAYLKASRTCSRPCHEVIFWQYVIDIAVRGMLDFEARLREKGLPVMERLCPETVDADARAIFRSSLTWPQTTEPLPVTWAQLPPLRKLFAPPTMNW
jgi:hypothetical protein